MPVVVTRDEEKGIVRQSLTDPWDWDEFIGVRETLQRYLDEAEGPTVILLDVQTLSIPRNALAKYRKLADTDLYEHPNLAGFIVISSLRLIQTMGDIFQRTFRREGSTLWFVKTEAEVPELVARLQAEAEG